MSEKQHQAPLPLEIGDDELDDVVGDFTEGSTLRLKSGNTRCTECGLLCNTFTFLKTEAVRLIHVRLTCGHETYIPERALEQI